MHDFFYAGRFSASSGKERLLFRDVEISLPQSTLAILSGPSGCGKTTLLRQIAGLARVDGVKRMLEGRSYTPDTLPQWRSRVLLMMQDAPVLSGTIRQNLAFPFGLSNASGRSFPEDSALRLMEQAGLSHVSFSQDARELSGGERHRLALVRALLWGPTVILADEPLSGLDPKWASACFEMLAAFAAEPGRAVLCVIHDQTFSQKGHVRLVLESGRLLKVS